METVAAATGEQITRDDRGQTQNQAARRMFGLTILLSSFLLFQLELIFAKHILPWFGGTPAVWTTCMLFFQLTLLAGYSLAHWGAKRSIRKHGALQLVLVGLVATAFAITVLLWRSPLTPGGQLRGMLADHPVSHILVILTIAVSGPFLLLSTTTPVLQSWFRVGACGVSTYRLYALSNLGSLFGLITYPFLLEWLLPLQRQAWVWNALFVLYAVVYGALCWAVRSWAADNDAASCDPEPGRLSWRMCMVWGALAACGSAMLLSGTNLLCEDVPVTPFLWVLPLCLYLLSFILAFDHPRWYRREAFYPLYVAAVWIFLRFFSGSVNVGLLYRTDAYLFLIFVICMICHGELARSKPEPEHLTAFYLVVSLGGVLGSVLVSIVAPRFFGGYWEFHLVLIACGGLALCALMLDRNSWLHPGASWKATIAAAVLLVLSFQIVRSVSAQTADREYRRDFFGVKQIREQNGVRYLRNGGVEHGAQYLDAARRREPLMYYSQQTGGGKLLLKYPVGAKGRRVGIVGLGTGALAAYGQPGDVVRFWEIDPQVIEIARGPSARFSYVRDSLATVDIIEADGRLAIENEKPSSYDVLILDAFSGDAIPMHLISLEAFRLYLSRLKPEGAVAFHISNRVVDLTPVMLAFSRSERVPVRFYMGMDAEYAVFSRDPAALAAIGPSTPYPWAEVESVLWTDGNSNLLRVLRR